MPPSVVLNLTKLAGSRKFDAILNVTKRRPHIVAYFLSFSFTANGIFFLSFYFFLIDIWTEGEVNKIMFNFYLQLLSESSCTTIILSALSMDFPQVVLKGSCLTNPAPENRFVKQEGSYK